jgi:hypothetical protein
MGRRTHSILILSILALNTARAHEHDEELTEEVAHAAIDSVLWIHIFLQAAVWGILFPIGMVFGLSRSRWHVPLQVCPLPPSRLRASIRPFILLSPFSPRYLIVLRPAPYHDFTIGESSSSLIVGCRDRAHARRLHTRARARWQTISSERAWPVRQYPPPADCGAACAGSVSQTAHPRAVTASTGCARSRRHRKVVSGAGMGPDALRRDRVPRVLS